MLLASKQFSIPQKSRTLEGWRGVLNLAKVLRRFFAWIQMHWQCSVSHVRFSCDLIPAYWWHLLSAQILLYESSMMIRQHMLYHVISLHVNSHFLFLAGCSQLLAWTIDGTKTCCPSFVKISLSEMIKIPGIQICKTGIYGLNTAQCKVMYMTICQK